MPESKARLGLANYLEMERGTTVPDSELTMAGQMRRALFRGERLQPRTAVARFGGSNGLLGQVVYQLELLGFVIDRTPGEDGFVAYGIVNLDHQPTERDFVKVKKSPKATKIAAARRKAKAAKKNTVKAGTGKTALAEVVVEHVPVHDGNPEPGVLPVLPGLCQQVSVYAQVVNDDGSITLGLRNGSRRWMVNLSGVIEA